MSKLTLLHINIIGVVVALLLAGILWYTLIKPKNEAVETTKASVASTETAGGTDAKIAEKDKELKKTQVNAKDTEKKWAVNEDKYMPRFPYDPATNDLNLYFFPTVGKGKTGQLTGFRDIPTVWGEWITAWYDAQRNQGIARLPDTEFAIKEFPADPNQLTTLLTNHLTFPEDGKTWPVKLECKSFDDAINHLKRFNHIEKHGMPVIDNVAIAGQSPNLVLSYDLGIYIIPHSKPPTIDPMIGAGGGAPGAPGAGPPTAAPGLPNGGGPGGGGPRVRPNAAGGGAKAD